MKNISQINFNLENLLKILNKENFTFSEKEIKNISKNFINENYIKDEMMYSYIGEAYIKLIGGKWKLNTTKKDPAYGKMCVVDWSKGSVRIDPQKLIDELKEKLNDEIIFKTIELTKKNITEINNLLKDLGLD